MSKKLLLICGPTATGKTRIACNLCRKMGGEIISADSRQVYKEMNIGTGKDIGKNYKSKYKNINKASKLGPCYVKSKVPIWGYDLAKPDENFSVSQYCNVAVKIVADIWRRKKLPVVVGGSGLYIKALIDGIDTISVPPDEVLRKRLVTKNPDELYVLLKRVDISKGQGMNQSDRKNPRRLVRAIEIAYHNLKIKGRKSYKNKGLKYDSILMIGLTAPSVFLHRRIKERVDERLAAGFEKEILRLLGKGIDWKYRSMQSMGYRQYENYFKSEISRPKFIENWTLEEQKYAKRQMVWFKKNPGIYWFDISRGNFEHRVEKLTQSWYYE